MSGEAKAELSKILKQIAELGLEGAAKYQSSEWQGLLQQDLTEQLNNSRNCKLEVFKMLQEKLILSSPPSKQFFQHRPQPDAPAELVTAESLDKIKGRPIRLKLKDGQILIGTVQPNIKVVREGFIVFLTENKLKMLKERYGNQEVFTLPVEITELYIDLIEVNQIQSIELVENILDNFQLTTERGKKIDPVHGFIIQVEGTDQPGYLRVRYQMPDSEKFVDLGELPVKDKILSLPLTMAVVLYVKEDYEKVVPISKHINNHGVITWIDEDMILPGDDLQVKMEQAIEKADYSLLFFSCQASNHIGHYNREIELALYQQSLRPEGKRFIIPIQLDECDVPYNLRKFSWAKTTDKNFLDKLLRAIGPSRLQQTLQ